MDAKGRVSVPADFRRVLTEADPDWTSGKPARGVLGYGDAYDGHLRLFHIEGFERLRQRIYAMPEEDEDRELLTYLCVTQAMLVEVGAEGRIILGQRHREKLGLAEGDLAFLGYDDYAEVWSAAEWELRNGRDIAARVAALKGPGGRVNINALINKRRGA